MKLKDFGFNSDLYVHGITCDSRQVKKGYIFAALPGSTIDGRNFIGEAINKGAIAVYRMAIWIYQCLIFQLKSQG